MPRSAASAPDDMLSGSADSANRLGCNPVLLLPCPIDPAHVDVSDVSAKGVQ